MLLASWTFYIVLKGFRSLNAKNVESVGQRAAKLPAIKVWEWFDPGPPQNYIFHKSDLKKFSWT